MMIVEYHRPTSIEEALELLARPEPLTVPLGGGSLLNRPSQEPLAVVDLQALEIDEIRRRGNTLEVGATATLQALSSAIAGNINDAWQAALHRAILHEATNNLRNTATLAGTLVGANGRSPVTTVLLAMDARLALLPWQPSASDVTSVTFEEVSLGDLLPVRAGSLRGRLIVQIMLPLNVRLSYEYVARTPADQPIVCAAVAQWPSGRTRLALGGFGDAPILAMDGPEPAGAEIAAREAASGADDVWASAEYRQEVADILVRRCLQTIADRVD